MNIRVKEAIRRIKLRKQAMIIVPQDLARRNDEDRVLINLEGHSTTDEDTTEK